METILVTGGTGLLGKNLQNIIDKTKYNWVFLSSKDGDLRIESDTTKIFELHKPDYVFHLAANVGGLFKNIKYPTEIFHDPADDPYIRLLPIETRKRHETVTALKRQPVEWIKIKLANNCSLLFGQ
jgi:hypothetical protein